MPSINFKKYSGHILAGALVTIVVIFACNIDEPAPKKPKRTATARPKIQCDLKYTDTQIIITNTGDSSLTGKLLTIHINGRISSGYKANLIAPAVNQQSTIQLRQFTKKDGTRFNPYATAFTRAYINCTGYEEQYLSAQ